MEPEWFQRKLGIIPVARLHVPSENLVAVWNKGVAEALDQIVPMQPLLSQESWHFPAGGVEGGETGEETSRALLVLNKGQT